MQPCQNKEGLCKQKELLGKINDDGKGLKWSAETPEGAGHFGKIYTQFRGDYKGALKQLIKDRDGDAIAALKHKELGDIDLVWGKEGTGESNGYGLSKLIKFHPEVVDNLDKIIYDMPIASRTEKRIQLESPTHQAAIRLDWDGETKHWLLTAFEKEKRGVASRTDIDKLADGMATPPPTNKYIIPQTKSLSQKYDDMIDRFWDKAANAFEWVDKKILAAGINKIGKLFGKEFGVKRVLTIENSVKEISAMINDFRNGRIQLNEEAAGIRDFLDKNLSKDELRDLIRALHGDSDASLLSANLKGIYDDLTARANEYTQQLVAAGALKAEHAKENYFRRYYRQYLEENDEFLKKSGLGQKQNYARQDLTYDERIALGMVEDEGFAIANSLRAQREQLLKAHTLKNLADRYGIDEIAEGYARVSDETRAGGVKRYGALGGKYVPREVYDAIKSVDVLKREMGHLERYWFPIIDHIKVNVTVKNPFTHLYNTASNVMMAYLHGDMKALYRVMKMMHTDKEGFRNLVAAANRQGLNTQLDHVEGGLKVFEREKKAPMVMRILKEAYFAKGSKSGDALRKAYDWEDKIFKLAQFDRLRREGMPDVQAMRQAQGSYVDYSTPLPGVVRLLDKSGLSPFLHYSYKATPMVLKAVMKHPLKFAMLQAAMAGAGASAWLGGNSERENYGKPKWAESKAWDNVLGVKSWSPLGSTGWFWNSGRLIPGMRFGEIDVLDWKGGFVGGMTDIVRGRNPLGGYPITKEDDSTSVKVGKRIVEAAQSYLPSLTFGRYGQRFAGKATGINPRKDEFGDEMDYSQIFAQGLGVRHFNEEKEIKKKLSELDKKAKKELAAAGNNAHARELVKRKYQEEKRKIESGG